MLPISVCRTRQHTRAHTQSHNRYISHRRTSLYVNCIRNSEYPANFLRADHLRISAKRTSIRRSLHHKFRRTCVTPISGATLHYRCTRRTEAVPLVKYTLATAFFSFSFGKSFQSDCSECSFSSRDNYGVIIRRVNGGSDGEKGECRRNLGCHGMESSLLLTLELTRRKDNCL